MAETHALQQAWLLRADALAETIDPTSGDATELARIRESLAAGYSDRAADQLELLAARIERRDDPLAYLLATTTGQEVQQEALEQLKQAEETLRHIASDLAVANANERLPIAQTLRGLLAEHRQAHSRALRLTGERAEESAAPADILDAVAVAVTRVSDDAESDGSPGSRDESPPVESPLAEKKLTIRHYDTPLTERTLASEDPVGALLAESRVDRAREAANQRAQSDPDAVAATQQQLTEASQTLREAARAYGRAWAQAATAPIVEDLATPRDLGAQLVAIAEARAAAYARRLSDSSLKGAPYAAMQRRYETLVAEARAARDRVAGGATIAQADIDRASRDARADLASLARSRSTSKQTAEAVRSVLAGALGDVPAGRRTRPRPPAALGPAEAALREAQKSADDAPVDVQSEATQAAVQQSRADVDRALVERLSRRTTHRSYAASLPMFTASRVLVEEDAVEDAGLRSGERVGYSSAAGVNTQTARSAADGIDGGAFVASEVIERTERRVSPRKRRAAFGKSVARSLSSLSSVVETGLRTAGPVGPRAPSITPMMKARMPSNIFADTSSSIAQQVYMPAIARLAGVPTATPAARMSPQFAPIVERFAAPEALYAALLGTVGERLREEEPEVAERLESRFKELARMVPDAGGMALDVLSRYTDMMRQRVESWLGGGDKGGEQGGIERGADLEFLDPEGGAVRAIGEYIGGLFHPQQSGSGESYENLIEEQAADVEERLRQERRPIDPLVTRQLEDWLGVGRSTVHAFEGPTSEEISRTIGGEAFTVKNLMFFQQGTLDSDSPQGRGLIAHEMIHAKEPSLFKTQAQIELEERRAYGAQELVEQQTANQMERTLNDTYNEMELAKELNIPRVRLNDELGGHPDSTDPDPGLRTQDPKDQKTKEDQIMDALVEHIEERIRMDYEMDHDRYGRDW